MAICVGCTGAGVGTTSGPVTTTTASEAPTTETIVTTTTRDPTACCDELTVSSSGGMAENYPELLGDYVKQGEDQGRPVFRHKTILTEVFLHYTVDALHKWEGELRCRPC